MACAVVAAAAWGMAGGRIAAPLGVLAGGLLAGISYRGIKAGIDALVGAMGDAAGPRERAAAGRVRAVVGLVKFFTRYAILGVAAWVIMARLKLPPVAVFAGASSLVIAVMLEALRGVTTRAR